ncbi:acyl-protein thioesterase [Xylariomycetidae sp. FL2044]|nr:acyl-protein thioesterase [Xylariomycetidae sp. FL2044]
MHSQNHEEAPGRPKPNPQATFVVEPTSTHTHSVIFLHGLSSNGEKFGTELLETGIDSSGRKLSRLLPGVRWIFPTAKRRRSTAFRRSMLTQWFDVARLRDPEYRRETQLQGLSESTVAIREFVSREMSEVGGPENVIIGGLSQGCAMSLIILLGLEHRLGGYIGMSGYLLYRNDIEDAMRETEEMDEDDPFAPSGGDDNNGDGTEPRSPGVLVSSFVRDLVGLEPISHQTREATAGLTPVFLVHGVADDKKPVEAGEAAAKTLQAAGYEVQWKAYPDLGHWYKIPDEIDDIVDFIRTRVGWPVKASIDDDDDDE